MILLTPDENSEMQVWLQNLTTQFILRWDNVALNYIDFWGTYEGEIKSEKALKNVIPTLK